MSEFIPAEHSSPPHEWTCHTGCGRPGYVLLQHVDEGWICAFCAIHNPMPTEPEPKGPECEHGKMPGYCPVCGDLRELAKRASYGPYTIELGEDGHEIFSPSERVPYDYDDALFMAACTPERILDLLDAKAERDELIEDVMNSGNGSTQEEAMSALSIALAKVVEGEREAIRQRDEWVTWAQMFLNTPPDDPAIREEGYVAGLRADIVEENNELVGERDRALADAERHKMVSERDAAREDLEAAYAHTEGMEVQMDRLSAMSGWSAKTDLLRTLGLAVKLESIVNAVEKKIRWRKWDEEPPPNMARILAANAKGVIAMTLAPLNGSRTLGIGGRYEGEATHWRHIDPPEVIHSDEKS